MPLPKPQESETQDEFIDRCMGDDNAIAEFPDENDRAGYCYSAWEEDQKMADVKIQKTDHQHQVVKGVVYAANYVDSDGETMTPEDVRKAAWEFLANNREKNIDVNHNWKQSGCYVVESYVTEEADEYFPKDAWILGVKCTDEVWEQVKAGKLNGFSFGGSVQKYPKRVLMEVSKQIVGVTEKNLNEDIVPPHSHQFIVYFDGEGNIVKGVTDVVEDHWHGLKHGTATEIVAGHAHRVSFEEEE